MITCGHCVRAITTAIHRLDSAAQIDIDLAGGYVRIEGGNIGVEAATRAIEAEGYAVVSVLEAAGNGQKATSAGSCCGTCHD